MTEDGMLFIVDRIKQMLIRHDGFKVFPSMIEKIIVRHKAVRACCVVGVLDSEHSQGRLSVVCSVLNSEDIGEMGGAGERIRKTCL